MKILTVVSLHSKIKLSRFERIWDNMNELLLIKSPSAFRTEVMQKPPVYEAQRLAAGMTVPPRGRRAQC